VDSPAGVKLTSTLRIGFEGDTGLIRWANRRYARRAFGGNKQDEAAQKWILHCLQVGVGGS
jgi:hypothetical protein